MKTQDEMLAQGVEEASEIMAGARQPARVRKYAGRILTHIIENGRTVWTLDGHHDVKVPDRATAGERVLAIRKALRQSQSGFAELLGVSLGTLQGWEQDRREPNGSAKKLLDVSYRAPEILIGAGNGSSVFA